MDRFNLVTTKLSDGSEVFSVVFLDDYDMKSRVTLECGDLAYAESLFCVLRDAVTSIAVDPMTTEEQL